MGGGQREHTLMQRPPPARRRKRRQGRPQKSEPTSGRETLIRATRELMKKIPAAKITRLDIARTAGFDPALVRYYFGGKSKLIEAAALQASAELRDRQTANFAKAKTPHDKIAARIAGLLEVLF